MVDYLPFNPDCSEVERLIEIMTLIPHTVLKAVNNFKDEQYKLIEYVHTLEDIKAFKNPV